jgi:hypothetical protein
MKKQSWENVGEKRWNFCDLKSGNDSFHGQVIQKQIIKTLIVVWI